MRPTALLCKESSWLYKPLRASPVLSGAQGERRPPLVERKTIWRRAAVRASITTYTRRLFPNGWLIEALMSSR